MSERVYGPGSHRPSDFSRVLTEEELQDCIQQVDAVQRPPYYRRGNYELIDILFAWGLDQDGCLMQAVQYIFRAGNKGSKLEDLEKAQKYLQWRIDQLKRDAQE